MSSYATAPTASSPALGSGYRTRKLLRNNVGLGERTLTFCHLDLLAKLLNRPDWGVLFYGNRKNDH